MAGCVVESLTGRTVEHALVDLVLRPWGLSRTTFDVPPDLVAGVEGGRPLLPSPYPRGRRPSGGLCSSASDLLTAGERLLDRPGLLDRVGTPRTRHDDPMRYGYGWAVGPSGQLFLNGRLPGYRAVWLIVPEEQLVAVSLAAGSDALPAQARAVSAVQHRFTGDDLAAAIEAFAA